jgi:hypothetical protein
MEKGTGSNHRGNWSKCGRKKCSFVAAGKWISMSTAMIPLSQQM